MELGNKHMDQENGIFHSHHIHLIQSNPTSLWTLFSSICLNKIQIPTLIAAKLQENKSISIFNTAKEMIIHAQ